MLFSVVIPVFNRSAHFAACLASVATQRFRDFETIVIDDASTEDIAAVVRDSRLPVRLHRQERNGGPGAARNAGLTLAAGEYVAFLDSDDTWLPWTLEIYARTLHQIGAPSFLAGREARDETDAVREYALRWHQHADYLCTAEKGVWIAGCAVVIKRELLLKASGFVDVRMNAEDSDLWLRLGDAPSFVEIVDPPVFCYQRLPGSLVTAHKLTLIGIQHLVDSERTGKYPGGTARQRDRRRILGRHVRPVLLEALKHGEIGAAWGLYQNIFFWQVKDRRWKFLFGFWLRFLQAWMQRLLRTDKA